MKRSSYFNGSRGSADKHRDGIKAFISLMDVKIRDVNGNAPLFSRRSWEYLPDKNDTGVTYIVPMLSFFSPLLSFFFFFFESAQTMADNFKDKHQILSRGNAFSSCCCQEIKEAAFSALLRLLCILDPNEESVIFTNPHPVLSLLFFFWFFLPGDLSLDQRVSRRPQVFFFFSFLSQ